MASMELDGGRVTLRDRLLDALFPRTRCMVCGGPRGVNLGLCAACREEMERYPSQMICLVCGRAMGWPGLCASCGAAKPPYAELRCVYVYRGVARELIHRMKFDGEFDLPVRLFAAEMAALARAQGWPVQAVAAVPGTGKTLRQRGYNQAELLGARVAQELGLPRLRNVLRKRRGTRSQVGLNAVQRRGNLAGAILPGRNAEAVRGKAVLLVDDIVTTGSTMEACAQALLRCGATAVYALGAARTPKEEPDDHVS